MTIKVTYRPKFKSLVSPVPDKKLPIYNWHSFRHSYSTQLVSNLLSEFNLKKGDWVLDPFCGGGTTLLSCKQAGIKSQGVDILPFSVFLSNVKTRQYNERSLLREYLKLRKRLNGDITINVDLPNDIALLDKAFSHSIRKELLKIKTAIDCIKLNLYRDFFNLAFLSILEKVSNTSKDGGFLRIVSRGETAENVQIKFLNKSVDMIADIIRANTISGKSTVSATAKLGDARNLRLNREFDAILSSPPYPNRHDYTRIYLLEMAFDFISDNNDLKQIRYDTLRSHVEARKKFETKGYTKTKKLNRLIQRVKNNGTNNPQVTETLEGYFEDMFLCLEQAEKRLKKKGKIALVVSNVRFAGVNIPVDVILSEIGAQAGLTPKAIWAARKRGNSSQQMKKYKRKPSRESIVVWEK